MATQTLNLAIHRAEPNLSLHLVTLDHRCEYSVYRRQTAVYACSQASTSCALNRCKLDSAGSSIMPGKVNPVIPEVLTQVAYQVVGHDVTITMAAEAGQLQLNSFEPVRVVSLGEGMGNLSAVCTVLARRCIDGITANKQLLRGRVQGSIGLVTARSPLLGYAMSTAIAQEALIAGRLVADLVVNRGLLDRRCIDELRSPDKLANLQRAIDTEGPAA